MEGHPDQHHLCKPEQVVYHESHDSSSPRKNWHELAPKFWYDKSIQITETLLDNLPQAEFRIHWHAEFGDCSPHQWCSLLLRRWATSAAKKIDGPIFDTQHNKKWIKHGQTSSNWLSNFMICQPDSSRWCCYFTIDATGNMWVGWLIPWKKKHARILPWHFT